MKIHIVSKEANPERILSRLAATLAHETGWSLGRTPRGDVDLNYFLPYLDYESVQTGTAAWFTHFDARSDRKAELWQQVAAAVDLRTTSTMSYAEALAAVGPVVKVPPPLDRQAFALADLPDEISIGVSGYVYQDGRKGEDLIRRLYGDNRKLNWQATGRGWSIPTRSVTTDQLPAFYQSLRLFVCASRIEGVPYPPLEALACGVPVVIPRGVGLLDDLPDLPGITRFDTGDYDSLKEAFEQALNQLGDVDREALRAATEPYTPSAWARAHEHAFEALLNPPAVEVLPDWRGCAGAYYVAFGAPARECALNAISHWHERMPGVPTALVSDAPLGPEDVFVEQPDADIGGRIAKISIDELAPVDWRYVLYMDADTEVVADVGFLFQALVDGWELVICKNPSRFHVIREMKRPDNGDECDLTFDALGSDELMQLNGGVFAFRRCERTARFFRRWRTEWERYGKRDQAALLRALYAEPLRVYVLGNEWNTVVRYDPAERTAGILHYPMEARRYAGHFNARLDSPEAWKQVRRWEQEHLNQKDTR